MSHHHPLIRIEELSVRHTEELLHLRVKNRKFLTPWEPLRSEEFYTYSFQLFSVNQAIRAAEDDQSYSFVVIENSSGKLIGRVNLNNLVRGVFQNAYLGYFIDQDSTGKGYATNAVQQTLHYGFQELRLHRMQAATLRHNLASQRVLLKNGFRYEGEAIRYLKINGEWQDHLLYAHTIEDAAQYLRT